MISIKGLLVIMKKISKKKPANKLSPIRASYKNAISFVQSLEKSGMKLGLKRILVMLKCLGNPQDKLKIIHVAGTNGKGSVCAMIAKILESQGYKVGLYISPHLVDYDERIQINSKKISKSRLAQEILKYKSLGIKTDVTLFEFFTAVALNYFAQEEVDFVVLETGLGGRLDATNVGHPIISIITSISLDHTTHLGKTIEDIAKEKAGIIKPGSLVVVGKNNSGLKIIRQTCSKVGACLIQVNNTNSRFVSRLEGKFQRENTILAVTAICELAKKGIIISEESIIHGLSSVKWPARFQRIIAEQTFGKNIIRRNAIVDCAHNIGGAGALVSSLIDEKKQLSKKSSLVFLVSIMQDKDYSDMIKKMCTIADKIILTRCEGDRTASPLDLALHVPKSVESYVIEDTKEAFNFALSKTKDSDILVISGSIYFIGELCKKKMIDLEF